VVLAKESSLPLRTNTFLLPRAFPLRAALLAALVNIGIGAELTIERVTCTMAKHTGSLYTLSIRRR
jgi:hypothetical protein